MTHRLVLVALALAMAGGSARAAALRVCADPNNLPFSNRAGQGFENKIVELIGKDLGEPVTYTWWAQRRGYVRNTLNAGKCDLVPGVAAGVDLLAETRPYYRSTYVFVTRADRNLHIASLDDPRLRKLIVGVQMVGDDANNTPPAQALAHRGVVRNVRGYMLYGDYTKPNPPAAIIDAVSKGDVDVAVAWGPLAGYFATREPTALTLAPVTPTLDAGEWPMTFAIAMGVRKGDQAFRRTIDAELIKLRPQIRAILAQYGVPIVDPPTAEAAAGGKAAG